MYNILLLRQTGSCYLTMPLPAKHEIPTQMKYQSKDTQQKAHHLLSSKHYKQYFNFSFQLHSIYLYSFLNKNSHSRCEFKFKNVVKWGKLWFFESSPPKICSRTFSVPFPIIVWKLHQIHDKRDSKQYIANTDQKRKKKNEMKRIDIFYLILALEISWPMKIIREHASI